jgi:hypothetical protein
MATVTARMRICNAATVFDGLWGAVTKLAQGLGCSRQALYQQARRVERVVAAARKEGSEQPRLAGRLAELQEENRQLWADLENAVDFPVTKQQQFTATATAMGLSLTQTLVLLAIVLPARRLPSRAKLGRWTQQWAQRAGRLLAVLDGACQRLVLMLCLDEIFVRRRPMLMGVEPLSMAWVIGQKTPDRSGETWCGLLVPWTRLTYTAVDGGSGLRRGLDLTQRQRTEVGPGLPLEGNLDNFHIQQEGSKALRHTWQEAEQIWVQAEQADRAVAAARRQGHNQSGPVSKARVAWAKAAEALAVAEQREAAYQRAVAALELFRPDGHINDRAWATAELSAATQALPEGRWAKFGRMARDPRALTFLDRLHRELQEAEPCAELRQALLALWRVRHPQRARRRSGGAAGPDRALVMVHTVICHKLERNWQPSYERVAAVLQQTVRASSVVECMNSVLRMHQARHRSLSQDLLNLKRLYWNCRTFAQGKRRDHCPYEHLGLQLPTYDWWALLQIDPAELEQKVSTSQLAE